MPCCVDQSQDCTLSADSTFMPHTHQKKRLKPQLSRKFTFPLLPLSGNMLLSHCRDNRNNTNLASFFSHEMGREAVPGERETHITEQALTYNTKSKLALCD